MSNEENYTDTHFYDILQFPHAANLKTLNTYIHHIHIVYQIKTTGLNSVIMSDISVDV